MILPNLNFYLFLFNTKTILYQLWREKKQQTNEGNLTVQLFIHFLPLNEAFYTCRGWSNKKFPAFWTTQGHKRMIRSQMLALQQTDLFSCKVSQPAETKFSLACRYKQQWFAKERGMVLDKFLPQQRSLLFNQQNFREKHYRSQL